MDSSLVSLMSAFVSEQFLRQCTASCIFEWVPIPRHIKSNEGDIVRGVFEVMRSKRQVRTKSTTSFSAESLEDGKLTLILRSSVVV